MNNIPLCVFVALLIGEIGVEYVLMRRTGSLRRTYLREWTYYAVAFPFKAMLVTAALEFSLRHPQPSQAALLTGTLLAVAGIAIRVRGHLDLRAAFSPYVQRPDDSAFVQTGMYAWVRHPMYAGSILLFVGLPLVLGARVAWLFTILGLVGIWVRIRREEAFLSRELPGYREYAQRTWRLVPYVY